VASSRQPPNQQTLRTAATSANECASDAGSQRASLAYLPAVGEITAVHAETMSRILRRRKLLAAFHAATNGPVRRRVVRMDGVDSAELVAHSAKLIRFGQTTGREKAEAHHQALLPRWRTTSAGWLRLRQARTE
jgi:hypothetical protein